MATKFGTVFQIIYLSV